MVRDARRNRLVAWTLAGVLFALGLAAGIAADRLVLGARPRGHRGPPTSAELAARLERELELDDRQTRAIRAILDARWDALAALSERFEPEAERIRHAADDEIRALLDPAQRARFDERVASREKRRAELRSRVRREPP